MKKKIALLLVATMAIGLVGCGAKEDNGTDTKAPVENSSESTLGTGDNGAGETTTSQVADNETTGNDQSTEETTTQKSEETTTKKPAETTTKKPAETTTQKPAETTTEKPEETEAPIVKKVGTVDEATYNKAVKIFEDVIKKLRGDGLIKSSDVCVTIEGSTIKVDMNYADKDVDLILTKDNTTKAYELILDYDFTWMTGLAQTINGKDSADYNKLLIGALLCMVTEQVDVVFDRIDSDCFSAFGLYKDKWTQIADISIKSGRFEADKYFSYYITKEDVDSRDKTYTLTGTTADGKTVECVIEYDSSKVTYEQRQDYLTGEMEDYMHHPTDGIEGPYGYLSVGSGCKSFEEYKQMMIQKYKDLGDTNPHFDDTYLVTHQVSGYTYYTTEFFYEYADAKGDPDIVYVQIGDNLYVEIFNFQSYSRFEDSVIDTFFIKEVKIK